MNTWGEQGESRARRYLESKGFRFVEGNFANRWGEIDLIMDDGGTLVFVEVKFRTTKSYGDPSEAITPRKQKHMERVAMMYVNQTKNFERMLRFDVVTIGPEGLNHYKNAFFASGTYY